MKYESQSFDVEERVRQDCYNRGYEQGRKNTCEEIVEYIEELQKQVKEYRDKIEQGTLIEATSAEKETTICDCYHTETELYYIYDMFTGKPSPMKTEVGVCWGTKERDRCECGGDRKKCDFYETVRNG